MRKRRRLSVAFFYAVVLTAGTYLVNNLPFLTGESLPLYAGLEYVKSQFTQPDTVLDSVLLIDVAYSRSIAEKEINGLHVGRTDVTDRQELTKLLQNLKKCGYRYIFLDIRFEQGEETPFDRELFGEIRSMPNLVIANHADITLADSSLAGKAAYSDYPITLTSTNFLRYRFLQRGGESMPLRAYRELGGPESTIRKYGGIYLSDRKLCYNSLVINPLVPGYGRQAANAGGMVMMYQNLNWINDEESLSVLARDKYVVIGNMTDDRHDTYFGKIPGSVIVFSAFWALKNGRHLVRPGQVIYFFLLYFILAFSLLGSGPVWKRIPFVRNSKSRLVRFLATLIGYSSVMTLAVSVLYFCSDTVSSILLPSLVFSIHKTYCDYKNRI